MDQFPTTIAVVFTVAENCSDTNTFYTTSIFASTNTTESTETTANAASHESPSENLTTEANLYKSDYCNYHTFKLIIFVKNRTNNKKTHRIRMTLLMNLFSQDVSSDSF